MSDRFNLDDIKHFITSNESGDNKPSFSLDDVLNDFKKDSAVATIEKEQHVQEVVNTEPKFDIEDDIVKKPEGYSLTGAFDAIKEEKKQKPDIQPEIIETPEPQPIVDEQKTTDNEIHTPIENKRFFNTETFNSIKDNSAANIKQTLASFATGKEEEDDGEEEFFKPIEPTEEIDDYTKLEDRQDIINELKKMNSAASIRTLFTFVLTAISALFFAVNNSWISLPGIDPIKEYKIFAIMLLCISTFATIVNINSFINGVKSISKLRFTQESCLSIIFLLNLVVDLIQIIPAKSVFVEPISFDFVYILFLYFNIFSKKLVSKTVLKNFLITSADGRKSVINMPTNEEAVNDIMLETGCNADIVYASKSEFISNFINNSFDDFELHSSKLSSFLMGIILAVFVVNIVMFKDFALALIYLLSAICVTFPILLTYSHASPLYNNSKKTRKLGGVIVGSKSAFELKDVQTLIVDDSDVFNTSLNGIRLYGQTKIDDAVLYLNSLFSKVGGPLNKLFSDMLSDDIVSLPRIDEIYYHDSMGYSGLIHSKVFVVGNKKLMDHFGIEVDDSEYSIIYQQNSKHVMFAAYDGKLMGVFLLSYSLSHGVKKAFEICEKNQIAVCIAERDANINKNTLFNLFKPKEKVLFNIISFRTARHCFDKFEVKHKTPSLIISHTGIKGLVAGLHSCKTMQFAFKTNKIITTIASIIAIPLITFLLFLSAPSQSLPLQVLVYQALWSLPILFISMFAK